MQLTTHYPAELEINSSLDTRRLRVIGMICFNKLYSCKKHDCSEIRAVADNKYTIACLRDNNFEMCNVDARPL